jgi:hypothetical protein
MKISKINPISLKFFLLLFIFSIQISSKTLKKNPMSEYIFIDRNGNTYTLRKNTIYYEPISMIESSSGFYDGGVSNKKKLNYSQSRKILYYFKKLLSDTDNHITNRVKGSYMIVQKNKNNRIVYNISSLSKNADETEITLRKILNQLE